MIVVVGIILADNIKDKIMEKERACTKQIEQVKSISSLIESKSSQVRDGFPSLNMRKQPPKSARAFSFFALFSLKLM